MGTAVWNVPQQTSETRSSGTLPNQRWTRLDEKQPSRLLRKQTTTHKNTSKHNKTRIPKAISNAKEHQERPIYECNEQENRKKNKNNNWNNEIRYTCNGSMSLSLLYRKSESLSPLQKWCSSSGSTGYLAMCNLVATMSCLAVISCKVQEVSCKSPWRDRALWQ